MSPFSPPRPPQFIEGDGFEDRDALSVAVPADYTSRRGSVLAPGRKGSVLMSPPPLDGDSDPVRASGPFSKSSSMPAPVPGLLNPFQPSSLPADVPRLTRSQSLFQPNSKSAPGAARGRRGSISAMNAAATNILSRMSPDGSPLGAYDGLPMERGTSLPRSSSGIAAAEAGSGEQMLPPRAPRPPDMASRGRLTPQPPLSIPHQPIPRAHSSPMLAPSPGWFGGAEAPFTPVEPSPPPRSGQQTAAKPGQRR